MLVLICEAIVAFVVSLKLIADLGSNKSLPTAAAIGIATIMQIVNPLLPVCSGPSHSAPPTLCTFARACAADSAV